MKITIPISLGVLLVWAQGAEAAGGFLSLPMTRHTPSQALVRRQTDVSLPVAYHRNAYLIDGTLPIVSSFQLHPLTPYA